ncbi:hypothetical protein U1Q18_003501 [Sarracenia purpurea var. burkii]
MIGFETGLGQVLKRVWARVRGRVELVEIRFAAGTVGVFPHVNLAFSPVRFISTRQNGGCHIYAMEIPQRGIKFWRLASGDVMAATHGLDHRKCQLHRPESDCRNRRAEARGGGGTGVVTGRIERRMAPEMTIVGGGTGVVTGSRRTEFGEQTSGAEQRRR